MEKIANEKIAEVLRDAATVLRTKEAENKVLREKVAGMELRDRATKLASSMHNKSLSLDVPREDLVEDLMKQASANPGGLDVIEKAVDMVAPDMGTKLAQIRNDDAQGTAPGSSDFERFIGGVG